jgi:hypothetical protein
MISLLLFGTIFVFEVRIKVGCARGWVTASTGTRNCYVIVKIRWLVNESEILYVQGGLGYIPQGVWTSR